MKKALYFRILKIYLIFVAFFVFFDWREGEIFDDTDIYTFLLPSFFLLFNLFYFLIIRFAKKSMNMMQDYYDKHGKLPPTEKQKKWAKRFGLDPDKDL